MNPSRAPFSCPDGLRDISQARLPWLVALALVAIHTAIEVTGGIGVAWRWYDLLGLRRIDFLEGRVWQPATYALLHGGWIHVGINALGIAVIGARVERYVGPAGFLKVLAAGVVSGGLVHLLLAPGSPDAARLVGASGGCVALLLVVTTLSPDARMWPLPVSGRSLGAGILLAELFLTLVNPGLGLPVFSGIGRWLETVGLGSWFSVGHACHLGGGLAGLLYGRWLLRPRISLQRLRDARARREARERIGS